MSRATGVYAVMFLIFGVGIWLILQLGATLQAPPDLAGTWKLQPISAFGRFKTVREMTVQQSGRFVLISFAETGDRLSMKLAKIGSSSDSATSIDIRLEGSPGLTFSGNPDGDRFRLQTDEPFPHIWNAVRVTRTYPKREIEKRTASTQPTTRAQ